MGDIRDFGARGDQVHDDGPAIQRAIDHTAKSGGVGNLQMRAIMLRWPSDANTSTGHGRRWEAGGHGQHTYAADAPSPPWAVLWGRGLVGGWLDIGNLRASDTSIPAIDVAMSARTILVVEDSGNEELDHDE